MRHQDCKSCALKNTFPDGIDYCMALCQFIDDVKDPPCSGKYFSTKDPTVERHLEILDAISKLR